MDRRLRLPWSGRRIGPAPVADVALAGALMVLAVGGLVTGEVMERPLLVTVPIAVVSTGVMAVRRRFPILTVGVVAVLAVAQALWAGHSSTTLWSLVVYLVVAYTVAAECDEGPALLGLGLVLASQFLGEWLSDGSDYPFDALVFGGVWLFGRGTRTWRDQAIRAEQHRDDLARIAVAEERTRIARELHDVVAHSLSVIAVQADAAEAALLKEPDRAVAPMAAIRGSARDALRDMRHLLRVLRVEEDTEGMSPNGDLSPARGLGDLDHLIATMRAAGLDLHADVEDVGPMSRGSELIVFRIVQEALTNARRHAGSVPTRLRVARDAPGQVVVEIENDAPVRGTERPDGETLSTGNGLLGIRERVQAAGGSLRTGPTDTGGFTVLAILPINRFRADP